MIGKKDFINDIKQYILNEFSQDANFSNVKVEKAYKVENTLTPPEIDIYVGDDREDSISNSYDAENISTLPIIFYCYNKAMIMNDDEEKTDVVDSTQALAESLIKIMDKNKLASNNQNIISSTRMNYVAPTKVRDDSVYVSIIRYEFKILNNYVKIYNI